MILISSNEDDLSTNDVIRWLYYYDKKMVRINSSTTINILTIYEQDLVIQLIDDYKSTIINLKDVKSYWYRRGGFKLNRKQLKLSNSYVENNLNNHLTTENEAIVDYIIEYLEKTKNKIGNIKDNQTNKIENLSIAKNYGLDVPNTIITNSKNTLLKWMNSDLMLKNEVVSKAINTPIDFKFENAYAKAYTSIITSEIISNLPDIFFPTIFQEKLEKKFELRIFYLNRKTYSMAIFSQNDPQTSVDFRNYNSEKPNRNTKFTLPIFMELKIIKIMDKLKMESGSLDVIYTKDNRYVFLEINPVGQFGMVSLPINYKLEKIIANSL